MLGQASDRGGAREGVSALGRNGAILLQETQGDLTKQARLCKHGTMPTIRHGDKRCVGESCMQLVTQRKRQEQITCSPDDLCRSAHGGHLCAQITPDDLLSTLPQDAWRSQQVIAEYLGG